MPPQLSIIIPALNEATAIEKTLLAAKALPCLTQVIVVDGGSEDDTVHRARALGATVIDGPRGRGSQMHAGSKLASSDVLFFLHADTIPPPEAYEQIAQALADDRVIGGNFQIHFAGDFAAARFLTSLYGHLAHAGLRYGDSGFFVRREAYLRVGGFRPYPIFEDLDLLERLARLGRFVRVPATIVTSSRRFEGRSFALTFLRWGLMQGFYWLGVSPHLLGKAYKHIRLPENAVNTGSDRC